MPNTGVKQKLGQPVIAGRPKGIYKNPYGVPAQEFYKKLRQQNRTVGNVRIQQAIRNQNELIQNQRTPDAFERKSVVLSDWQGGDF